MGIFKKSKADAATASIADDNGRHEHDDAAAEISALENVVDNDPAARAAVALEAFSLTPGAKSLLDRAVDNIATNDGAQIEDPELKLVVQSRATLINASGNDLSIALACITDACAGNERDIAPMVYSLLYQVQKNALFYANLDYRRYLDPRADFDLTPYMRARIEDEAMGTEFETDQRSEQREPPLGLDATIDREWEYFRSVYGSQVEMTDDIFAASLADLRLFLTLTAESFGWDPERPMPYANIAEKDGTFTPITDPQLALDHAEVRRKEALRAKRIRDTERMAAAAARATAVTRAALKR